MHLHKRVWFSPSCAFGKMLKVFLKIKHKLRQEGEKHGLPPIPKGKQHTSHTLTKKHFPILLWKCCNTKLGVYLAKDAQVSMGTYAQLAQRCGTGGRKWEHPCTSSFFVLFPLANWHPLAFGFAAALLEGCPITGLVFTILLLWQHFVAEGALTLKKGWNTYVCIG